MKNKGCWKICLIVAQVIIIIFLIAFLIAEELDKISISFSDWISIASTIISIILSVVAIFYTIISGSESKALNDSTQRMIGDLEHKIEDLTRDIEKDSSMLVEIALSMRSVEEAAKQAHEARETIEKSDGINEIEKKKAIEKIKKAESTMGMFISLMQGRKAPRDSDSSSE